MESKITFLGTGGGRVVVSNQIRASGGFVVNIPNYQIHVDPGPGALTKAGEFKVRLNRTNIIFVSHAHIDHVNDLNAVIDAMTLGGVTQKGVLISTTSVIRGEKDYPWLRKFYKKQLNDIFVVKPGDKVKISELNFTATKTKHDEECVGMKLDSPEITIGYTSDTAYFRGLAKEFKGSKILIMNVLRPGTDRWKTHMSTEDALKLVEDVRPELAILQHFGAKMIKANPLYEAREIQRRTGVRTIAATDGMVIELGGLSSEAIQTQL